MTPLSLYSGYGGYIDAGGRPAIMKVATDMPGQFAISGARHQTSQCMTQRQACTSDIFPSKEIMEVVLAAKGVCLDPCARVVLLDDAAFAALHELLLRISCRPPVCYSTVNFPVTRAPLLFPAVAVLLPG